MIRINQTNQAEGIMGAIVRPIRSYPLTFFTILACLLGWAFFLARALGAGISPDQNPLGPMVAAAIVVACLGRAGWKEWGRQLATLRAGLGWYALALLAPVAIIVAVVLTNTALGAPLPTLAQLAGWVEIPGEFVAILILIGIGEEAGWTAFAAPRLLRRHSFLTAWLILAAIRVFWHLPLMLSGDLPLVLGIGGNIAFQFLMLWLFRRTNAWFLVAIWHAALNTTSGSFFFQMVQGEDQARLALLMTAGYILVAAVVFLRDRHLLAGTPPQPPVVDESLVGI